jgi:hypothetical protein
MGTPFLSLSINSWKISGDEAIPWVELENKPLSALLVHLHLMIGVSPIKTTELFATG